MSDLSKHVLKRFPENRDMQLVCLRAAVPFHCSHCKRMRRANLVALVSGDWDRLLCNACYEELLSQPLPEPPEELVPKEWLGAVVSLEDAEKDNMAMGKPFGRQTQEWEDFKAAMLDGDEICEYAAPADAAEHPAGQAGYALLRDGVAVKRIVTQVE
jgi:hypothetical protein